jgi:hypothetical protein
MAGNSSARKQTDSSLYDGWRPLARIAALRNLPRPSILDMLRRSYGVMSFHVGWLLDSAGDRAALARLGALCRGAADQACHRPGARVRRNRRRVLSERAM